MKRFVQFCLVGISGLFVDMGVLFFLSDAAMLGWRAPIGKAVAVEAAIVNNFIWNDLWTFRDRVAEATGVQARLNRFGRFNLVYLLGLVIGVSVVWVLHGLLEWNLYVANLLAVAATTLWNFGLSCRFSWAMLPIDANT